MKKHIVVVFSSHLDDETDNKFIKHINDTIGVSHSVSRYVNKNEFSLTNIYNKALLPPYNDTIFVMCHNDILFKTKNWGRILLTKFNNTNYDIIGVAGSSYIPKTGMWWEDRSKMVGIVEHTDGISTWVSEYSKESRGKITPVVCIDGLFIAFNPNTIINKFDEDFNGFHFYDLSFSTSNYLDGCNIGVTTDIRILHKSIGRTNNDWEMNRILFVKKYYDELPIYLNVKIINNVDNYIPLLTEDEIMVNIITRTHNRPNYFRNCRESIVNQTYSNINHIVGSDVLCDYYSDYIKVDEELVDKKPDYLATYPTPWNLYLNKLNNYVTDGWIMYLDDDDMFVDNDSLSNIVKCIEHDDELIIWRVDIDGRIVPSDDNIGKIVAGDISGIGFMFHSKHLPVKWTSWNYGDYRVINELSHKLDIKFIKHVFTKTQGKPNNGKKPIDI